MIINNKVSYKLTNQNDGSINVYNLMLVLLSQIKLIFLIITFGLTLSYISYNFIFDSKTRTNFRISDSNTLKFYYDKRLIKNLEDIDFKTNDFTNRFVENLSNYDLFIETVNNVLKENYDEKKYLKFIQQDIPNQIYRTLTIQQEKIDSDLYTDAKLSLRSYKITFDVINNFIIGDKIMRELAINSNNLLTEDIKSIVNKEIISQQNKIKLLKFSHNRNIENEIKLILDQIEFTNKENDLNYSITLKKLEDNLLIAKSMNYEFPQLSTIVQNQLNPSALDGTVTKDQSFYSDKIVVPAYFFGTKILEGEIIFIKKQLEVKMEEDLNLATLYIQLEKQIANKKEVYIQGLDDYKDRLQNLIELKNTINSNYVRFISFNLNNINSIEITTGISQVYLISLILALFLSFSLALFINVANEIRSQKLANDK